MQQINNAFAAVLGDESVVRLAKLTAAVPALIVVL